MKKRHILLIAISLIIIIILSITPTVARRYINNNSNELIGRKVVIEKLKINYFNFSIAVEEFAMYEPNDKDIFVAFDLLDINFQPWKLISNEYAISAFLLDGLLVNVDYDGEHFNFDDLAALSEESDTIATDTIATNEEEESIKFSVRDFTFSQGEVNFHDEETEQQFNLNDLNLALPEFSWNNESSELALSFELADKGKLGFFLEFDMLTERYVLNIDIEDLDLDQFTSYAQSSIACSSIQGKLDNQLQVNGSFVDVDDIVISGIVTVDDFLLVDNNQDTVIQFEQNKVTLDSIDLKHYYFKISEMIIIQPEISYKYYNDSDNISTLFMLNDTLPIDSITETKDSIPQDSLLLPVRYYIDSVVMVNGIIKYNDYTLNRPFTYSISEFNTKAKRINSEGGHIPITYDLLLNNSASLKGTASIDMLDTNYLHYDAVVDAIDLTSFSPYSEYFIGRPISMGNFSFTGNANMKENEFIANNNIKLIDFELGDKSTDKPQINLPVKLAVAIMKDKDGDIILDIPMSGNPNDPDFNVLKLVGQTLSNLIVKMASTPFMLVSDINGVDPERIKEIKLDSAQYTLSEEALEQLSEISIAITEKPELLFVFNLETPNGEANDTLANARIKALKDELVTLKVKSNSYKIRVSENNNGIEYSRFRTEVSIQ